MHRIDYVVDVHLKGMVLESNNCPVADGNLDFVLGKIVMFYPHYDKVVEMLGLGLKEVDKREDQDHFKEVVTYLGNEKLYSIKNDVLNEDG